MRTPGLGQSQIGEERRLGAAQWKARVETGADGAGETSEGRVGNQIQRIASGIELGNLEARRGARQLVQPLLAERGAVLGPARNASRSFENQRWTEDAGQREDWRVGLVEIVTRHP